MSSVTLTPAALELLNELSARINRDPSDFLCETISFAAAGYFNLETILPQKTCMDPEKVLSIVRQLPHNDHAMPVTVELPAELTGGEAIRAHRVPLTW